ncbi:MAG: 50S ribosomal protein L5 [Chloroflexi bacterium]|nr:50S ribosomal protein L5 [Chloroflexota bacterium]
MPGDGRAVESATQSERKPRVGAQAAPKRKDREAKQPARDGGRAPQPQAQVSGEGKPRVRRVPRLLKRYREEIVPALMRELAYRVPMQVPRLEKVVLNIGLGEALQNANALEAATQQLATISGQHPVVTKAKRSIAAFKLREGMRIGAMVTLRSHIMYDFVDRLINVALPRIRDFQGVPRKSFDGSGNYTLGVREQVVFPEIDYNRIDRLRGLQITVVTTAKSDGEALRLLELLGMPFARDQARS